MTQFPKTNLMGTYKNQFFIAHTGLLLNFEAVNAYFLYLLLQINLLLLTKIQ